MVSLTPLRFSRTQDRGNGKNPVPSSPLPVLQSIPLAMDGRNADAMQLKNGGSPTRDELANPGHY